MTARILVVEDEAIIARDVCATLTELGYQVLAPVATGAAAIAAVTRDSPDLVLMDIHLKGAIDGIEAAAQIRQHRRVTPVIYLTSYADDATIQRAKATAAYGYVLKPFTDRDLRTAIEVALEKREIEARLSARERWFATTLHAITDAVIAVDAAGAISFMNAAAERLCGARAEDDGVIDVARLLEVAASDEGPSLPVDETPLLCALRGQVTRQADLFIRVTGRPGGWHSINASPVHDDDGRICGAVMVSRDITDLRQAIARLEQAAVRDELTGLLNRRGFHDRAAHALALAERTRRPLALIYIDVNGLKAINDELGHPVGDLALVETAGLMRRTFRASDILARLGGDEFAVLACDYADDLDGAAIRRRFHANVKAWRLAARRAYPLSASLGITVYDPQGEPRTMAQLIAEADAKMYIAKERRRPRSSRPLDSLP